MFGAVAERYLLFVQAEGVVMGEDGRCARFAAGDLGITDLSRRLRCAYSERRAVMPSYPKALSPLREDEDGAEHTADLLELHVEQGGSVVTGTADEYSDLDLVLVSPTDADHQAILAEAPEFAAKVGLRGRGRAGHDARLGAGAVGDQRQGGQALGRPTDRADRARARPGAARDRGHAGPRRLPPALWATVRLYQELRGDVERRTDAEVTALAYLREFS
ncbi:nucleotidyltransferase-like protein [Kribbella orskensis]|uniref:Nucleotidyltransferase-like protein n=1 Tax=Kribbella orskensis TaxID=2512216 RepID=A0ABY2BHM3_9ACTN|nr:nucleotidyltransferase-like protein [Kribbella sp. VKM Ac-2500]TCO17909.1 nucleotidyltransferase-like protein [Kribbella orskensis]